MKKESFKELKNIQIVLLSAMFRVDRKYTLFQFEKDIKSVLTKCVKTFKKTNIADGATDDARELDPTENEAENSANNENESKSECVNAKKTEV